MWKILLEVLGAEGGDDDLNTEFERMLKTVLEMAEIVRPYIVDGAAPPAVHARIQELDLDVNELQRSIRRQIVVHLSLGNPTHAPHGLRLMSLVKDVERIGDYVKDICRIPLLGGGPVPDGPLRGELGHLVEVAHRLLAETAPLMRSEDQARTTELLEMGGAAEARSDALLASLAESDVAPRQTISTVLLTHFYRRIAAHAMNVLSSVVMPVHELDFHPGPA